MTDEYEPDEDIPDEGYLDDDGLDDDDLEPDEDEFIDSERVFHLPDEEDAEGWSDDEP